MSDLANRFREHLQATNLLPLVNRILVGYSGGADSTCLLHLCLDLDLNVAAAHLHHGQRPEADEEAAKCENMCNNCDVPFLLGKADVPKIARERGIGLEEAGREARRTFFHQAAAALDCLVIATAHTRDDHLETMLFNMARGTGLRGLGGIRDRNERLVRPLLPFTRAETRAYCDENGLWYHDDPSNEDLNLSRARIRHRILPEMRALNQQTDQHLVLLSLMADEEDRFMDGVAAAMLEQAEAPLNGELAFLTKDCELAFDRSFLAHMPFVTLRRALRMGVEALGADMEFFKTQGLAEDIVDGANGSVTCEGGKVEVVYDADSVHFRQVQPIEPYRFPLTVPGETLSDEFGWSFQAFPDSAPSKVDRSGLTTFVDPSKVKGALHFRTFQTGDEIVPLGFDHRRKLSDLLSEAKLSKAARGRLPIVCDMVGPIWIPGVCVSEKVRPQAGQSALCLRFGPIQSDSAT